jgi:hypothetical protein
MEIRIDKNVVEFTPDSESETKQLEELWRVIVDCARFSRKMIPIGEYIPTKRNMARFAIEGELSDEIPEKYAEKEGRYVCLTCNKYVILKRGDQIPLCCGKIMEFYD